PAATRRARVGLAALRRALGSHEGGEPGNAGCAPRHLAEARSSKAQEWAAPSGSAPLADLIFRLHLTTGTRVLARALRAHARVEHRPHLRLASKPGQCFRCNSMNWVAI